MNALDTTSGEHSRCGGRGTVALHGGVAVKRLHARPEAHELLRREVLALAVCHHFALPRLVAWTASSRTIWMTGFPGIDLEEHVRRYGPLQPERVWQILTALADALHQLHGCGLFHLDVKPRNIVLESIEGARIRPRLVDLGSCGGPLLPLLETPQEIRLRRLGTGKFRHCCVEQLLQHSDHLGGHWDAFGLGASAYYALRGKWPADNDNPRIPTVKRYYRLVPRFSALEPASEAIRVLLDPSPDVTLKCLHRLARIGRQMAENAHLAAGYGE